MEYLFAIMQNLIGSSENVPLMVVMLSSLAVFFLVLSVTSLLTSSGRVARKRIKSLSDTQIHRACEVGSRDVLVTEAKNGFIDPLEKYLTPQKGSEREAIKQLLMHAGFYNRSALKNFYAIKVALCILLPILTLIFLKLDLSISTDKATFYVILAAAMGVFTPNYVLKVMINIRQKALRKSFPDALDLLVVCVESGMSLDAAFQKVSHSLTVSAPELSDELVIVNSAIRVGMTRAQALNQMLARTGLNELKGLISILDQSARYGSSVADSLRIYSHDFRDKRTQAAEEEAAKVGTKLIFPMILCIWPSFFIVAVGPAILKVSEVLQHLSI